MAFFSNNNSDYFSLSINPNDYFLPYIFNINKFQMKFLSAWLNLAMPASLFSLLATFAISIYSFLKSDYNCVGFLSIISVGLSLIIYMVNFALFFWIRFRTGSKIDKSYKLDSLKINRGLSLKLYITCLFTLLSPLFGLIATGEDLNIDGEISQTSSLIGKLLLLSGIISVIYFVAKRIIFLLKNNYENF